MASPAVQNALDSVAAIKGITQSYVDFTTKLVTDVMNSLVASSISQMRAYADLVSTLERGLNSYKAQVSTPQVLINWLESRIPETGSDIANLKVSTDALSQHSADIIRDLYATKLVSILGPVSAPGTGYVLPGKKVADMSTLATTTLDNTMIPKADATGATEYDKTNLPAADANGNIPIDLLSAIQTTLCDDAAQSYQILDQLVKMGMLRIVVTDGHILTKMTFDMSTSDSSRQSSSDIYGSAFAVSGSAGASWGWGHAAVQASYSSFNVHASQSSSQNSTDIQVAMMGEVLVNYKSDYYPQLPSQAKP